MDNTSVNWEVLHEFKNPNVDKLFNLYREDKLKARVYYINNNGHDKFKNVRVVKFDNGDNDFGIVLFKRVFGISITSKIYNRETRVSSIIYKGGKFYYSEKNKLKSLTFSMLLSFINSFNDSYLDSLDESNFIYRELVSRFSWIRFISENKLFYGTSFNTIIRNKLYNSNDLLRYLFKVPLPVVKVILKHYDNGFGSDLLKLWKGKLKQLINIENLRYEFINNEYFNDTVRMANMLDEKVNCSWSLKRLKQEHNNFTKRVGYILMECEDLKELKVNELHYLFERFSGYKLLKTNRELLYEGYVMKHCVGTYINKVNNGTVGIYHIDGYTFEMDVRNVSINLNSRNIYENKSYDNYNSWINKDSKFVFGLRIIQYRGSYNVLAPFTLFDKVFSKVIEFNYKLYKNEILVKDYNSYKEQKDYINYDFI